MDDDDRSQDDASDFEDLEHPADLVDATENLEAVAGPVVAAHSHVVSANGSPAIPEKTVLLNRLLTIAMEEKNDGLTRQNTKTLMRDEKAEVLKSNTVSLALGKRVLEVQEDNAKRYRKEALEELEIY